MFAIANIEDEKLKMFVKVSPIARGILENNIFQNEDQTVRALKNMAVAYRYELTIFYKNFSEVLHLFRRRTAKIEDETNFNGIDIANSIEIEQESDC